MRANDDPATRPPRPRLKRRAEFLRVGKGRRWHGSAFSIQAEARSADETVGPDGVPRFGFTLTKKVGNAVVRNRARRRLREAVRLAPGDLPARPGHDYVIVGRLDALRVPFDALRRDLAHGLAAVHERGRRREARPAAGRDRAETDRTQTNQANSRRRAAPERTRPQP